MTNHQRPYHYRILIIAAIFSAAGLVLVAQLVRWQILEHQTFTELAEDKNQKDIILKSTRGNIYDAHNHLLATESVQYEISVSPHLISNPEAVADRLSPVLNLPHHQVLHKLASEQSWELLTRRAPAEVGQTLLNWDITGVVVTPRSKRVYPENVLAAHLLGFVNDNNDGFYGIEGYYDSMLRGIEGHQIGEHGPFGELIPLGHFEVTPPTGGADLYLTVNRAIQRVVEAELEHALSTYNAESGTIVVMAPRTGAILAAANQPSYNPNQFANSQTDHFLDRLVSWSYEPGSVFKIVTMAAALDTKTIAPSTTLYDSGVIEIGGRVIYNSNRQANGTVDMTTVLAKSLNVGTSQLAMAMGAEKFYKYVRRFGFGRLTEIDLSGEGQGTLKSPLDSAWHQSDLGTNSFGQGIAVTPVQMLNAVAAVANDGLLLKPHVVKRIVNHNTQRTLEIKPQVVRRAISADTANILTQMLVTALEMSDSAALIPRYKVAGKTGTAEIPIPGGYHPYLTIASFIGYFPADDPQAIALIILNKPTVSKWGSATAAPTFHRLGKRLITLMDIPPDDVRLAQR